MAKKQKENEVFFNLFNAEDDSVENENSEETQQNGSEEFISIAHIENESVADAVENTDTDEPVQTTIFDLIDETVELKEYTLDGEESSNNLVVEPVKREDDFNESEMVSMLETNPLVDEQEPPEVFVDDIADQTDIFNNLPSYKEIKKSATDQFETPYLYNGKNSDHVRYRLSLPSKRNAKFNRIKKIMFGWLITIVAAVLVAVILRAFVFVIATVDGPSMMPTLDHNEKLLVTKFTYTFSDIERGDVVICRYDKNGYNDVYVKRVIGLGGEHVRLTNGTVFIDDVPLSEDYILEPMICEDADFYVPEGSVFVMGDNRNNSADSRKIGPIKEEQIIGKVQLRISPLNKFGSLEDKK